MLNEERDKLDKANMELELKKELAFRKRCEALEPMLKELNDGMKQMNVGVKFILHTDEKYFPCPAIHIDRGNKFRSTLYEDFGEIFRSNYDGSKKLDQDIWKMGSCNMHRSMAKTDEDLVKFVVKKIADKCFKRKSLRSA
jgi:uncharacterized hydantoinase/oxoprolinase family protein